MAFGKNSGMNQLASVLSKRIRSETDTPPLIDFGEIQENGSLLTNTFPIPIPRGDYMICRQLTLGEDGTCLTVTETDGDHEHTGGGHEGHETGDGTHTHKGGIHGHIVPVPEQLRGIRPGDRVLVAWVQNEAVVIDIIIRS
ncbi:MAG: hypothetical protein NC409_12400 [Clostridium sp.]|nr:hypothetical protein [Clostridium sp.]